MPGIVGLITKMPRAWAEPQLARMVEKLRHESFYTTGTWIEESLGVYAGWAARQGSFCDGMPLANERQDRVLIFSGEDFPEPGAAERLKTRGHVFEPEGPSYLVHAAEDDPAFPAGLNGRFHGLLVDAASGTATLFNDRYAMHRVYYHEAKEAFYFAGEAKAIVAVRPELRRLDARGLGEFVSCGCVLENRTLFEKINGMPPASAWEFRNGTLEARRAYFDPRAWEEQAPLEAEAWYEELRSVFTRNLPRYFDGRERVALSLTGGLDCRMITAWHKPAPGAMPCYTFGGSYRDCQDVTVARQVAAIAKQPHEVIGVGKDFLSRFPRYAERAVYLSDGCVEVNRAPALYCNERARAIAPVRMTGNFGTEVLRPDVAFKPEEPMPGLFHPDVMAQADAARGDYNLLVRTHPVAFSAFRQAPWYHYGLQALENTQVAVRTPYLDNDLVKLAFRAPASALASGDACLRLIADGDSSLGRLRTDRGLAAINGSFGSAMIRNWLEFTFKAEYAYDYGMPQWVARTDHVFSPLHFERLFLGRHKFYHFRVWYRDALAGYIRELLLDSRSLSRPYLERKGAASMVLRHTRGELNYTREIHKVLTLELFHRLFIDP